MAKEVDLTGLVSIAGKALTTKALLVSPYFWGGLIIVLILSVLSYVYLIPEIFKTTLATNFIWVIIGFLIGILLFRKQGKFMAPVGGIIVVILVVMFFIYVPDLKVATAPAFTIIKDAWGFTKGIEPVKVVEDLIQRTGTSAFKNEEGPNFKKTRLKNKIFKLNSFKLLNKKPLIADFNIEINTKTKTTLKIRCLLGNNEITASESTIELEKGKSIKTITCTAPESGEKGSMLTLKLEGTFKSESLMEIYLGMSEEITEKIAESEIKTEGPYNLQMQTVEKHPFIKESNYRFYVGLSRTEKNSILKTLKTLKVSTGVQSINIECEEPFNELILTATREEINSRVTNEKTDEFSYICNLQVLAVPEKAEVVFIETAAVYDIEKEFKQTLS